MVASKDSASPKAKAQTKKQELVNQQPNAQKGQANSSAPLSPNPATSPDEHEETFQRCVRAVVVSEFFAQFELFDFEILFKNLRKQKLTIPSPFPRNCFPSCKQVQNPRYARSPCAGLWPVVPCRAGDFPWAAWATQRNALSCCCTASTRICRTRRRTLASLAWPIGRSRCASWSRASVNVERIRSSCLSRR